jgi:SSS family transporter
MLPLAQSFFGWIDITVVVAYLGLLIGIGAYFARRQKNMEDYFLAGKSMGWIPVGMSLMAALNSGLDYMAGPFGIFKYGLIFIMGATSWLFLYPWVSYVTMPFYRRMNIISAYEYLEQRFNAGVRTLSACIFLLWRLGWMATALFVPSLVISTTTGWPLLVVIFVLGTFVTIYTVLGGVEGIIWTDVIQFCLMLAGVIMTLIIAVSAVDGGIAGIFRYAAAHGRTTLIEPFPATATTIGAKLSWLFNDYRSIVGIMIATMVGRATTYTCEQSTVQRFKATKSLKDAKRAFIVNALGDTVWTLGLAFVGMALFAYFKGVMPRDAREDTLTIYFMREAFPSGLNGLVVAAVLASGLSAIDASINACSSVIMSDFYKPYIAPMMSKRAADVAAGASESLAEQQRDVTVSRIVTIVFAIIGMFLATQVQHLGDIIVIAQTVIQTFTGPLLALFLLGMFTRRAHGNAVIIGGTFGMLLALFIALGRHIPFIVRMEEARWGIGAVVFYLNHIGFIWPTVFGFAATWIVSYALSLVMPDHQTEEQRHLTWRDVMKRRETDDVAGAAADAAAAAAASSVSVVPTP